MFSGIHLSVERLGVWFLSIACRLGDLLGEAIAIT